MTLDTLLGNHDYNCLLRILEFDLCLVSDIFSFSHVFLCPILHVMDVNLLQLLGIWFIKATTVGNRLV